MINPGKVRIAPVVGTIPLIEPEPLRGLLHSIRTYTAIYMDRALEVLKMAYMAIMRLGLSARIHGLSLYLLYITWYSIANRGGVVHGLCRHIVSHETYTRKKIYTGYTHPPTLSVKGFLGRVEAGKAGGALNYTYIRRRLKTYMKVGGAKNKNFSLMAFYMRLWKIV